MRISTRHRRSAIGRCGPLIDVWQEPYNRPRRGSWRWPIPSFNAFCRSEPSDLFISFAIFGTGAARSDRGIILARFAASVLGCALIYRTCRARLERVSVNHADTFARDDCSGTRGCKKLRAEFTKQSGFSIPSRSSRRPLKNRSQRSNNFTQTQKRERLLTTMMFSERLSLNNNTKQRFRGFCEGRTDLRARQSVDGRAGGRSPA